MRFGAGAGRTKATLDEAQLAALVAVLAAERALGGLHGLLGARVEVLRVALGLLEETLPSSQLSTRNVR